MLQWASQNRTKESVRSGFLMKNRRKRRMRSTNLFIVRGHVGADAKGFDGGKVAKFSVATNRAWNDRQTGEKKEATDWVTLTILNPPYSVRPDGAYHQWRKEPPRKLSVGPGS